MMQLLIMIWVAAFIISLLGLMVAIIASIVLWHVGPRDRVKYIFPVIPIVLAVAIRSSLAIFW